MSADILLSTYNGEDYIKEQLESLLNQDYININILIRDDGSTDETVNIIKQYKLQYPNIIKIINNNNQNLGSSGSFLELLKQSTSDYIFFCDQDDFWYTNKVSETINYYLNNCKNSSLPVLVHSGVDVVNDKLEKLDMLTTKFIKNKRGMEHSLIWQIFQNDVTGCTVMVNKYMRELLSNFEYTRGTIIQHDWFLAIIAYLYGNKLYLHKNLMKYRQHSNNVIGVKDIPIIKKIKNKIFKNNDYKFYSQIAEVLSVIPFSNKEIEKLQQFVNLQKCNKFKRIIWHIKNHFFRTGNVFYKIYQLMVC